MGKVPTGNVYILFISLNDFQDIIKLYELKHPGTMESFYHVKYGLSIITSKSRQKLSVMKTKKTGVSRKIVCFGTLIHILS